MQTVETRSAEMRCMGLLEVLKRYEDHPQMRNVVPAQAICCMDGRKMPSTEDTFQHTRWLLVQIREQLELHAAGDGAVSLDLLNVRLGMVQGALWQLGLYSTHELDMHIF